MPWPGKASILQSRLSEGPGTGGHHGKAIVGKLAYQVESSGDGYDAVFVDDFHVFDLDVLLLGVQCGSEQPDSLNAAPPVSMRNHQFRIKVMEERPLSPYAGYRGSGVNEHTVNVEKKGFAGEDHFLG